MDFTHALKRNRSFDFGDIMIMPTMGAVSSDNKKLFIDLSHANEKASAGYYAVKPDKHNIDVSLTTSTRGCINIL
jgi:putative alpha-1,2-mannosidase